MRQPLKRSLSLVLGCLAWTTSAWAAPDQRPGSILDFKSGRSNGVAGLRGDGNDLWGNSFVIDPGRLRLTAPQFKALTTSYDNVQEALREFEVARASTTPTPEQAMTYEQWWNQLPTGDRTTLERYGVTWMNAKQASLTPYFTYSSSGDDSEPKDLYVVDQDFFNPTVTSYKNKSVTRYRTVPYSYTAYAAAGRCGCRGYYYTVESSYQEAYIETIQVPAAFTVAVEPVTPNKIAEDLTVNRTRSVPYTDYVAAYQPAGRCGCRGYTYYREVTNYRDETYQVTTLELKDQVPQNDDQGRPNLFAAAGARPDADSNITFETDDDGNIIFQAPADAAEGHSEDIAEVVNNPAHPRPH